MQQACRHLRVADGAQIRLEQRNLQIFPGEEKRQVFPLAEAARPAGPEVDPDQGADALYAPCTAVRSAGARLLLRAQAEGTARADMDADDLFALMSGLGWLVGQPAFAPRADHLSHLITSAILTNRPNSDVKKATC